jgi:hypothetical protein
MRNRFNLDSQAQEFYPAISQEMTSRDLRAGTPVNIQLLKDTMVRLANQEWKRWGRGTIKEWNQSIRPILQSYWLTGTGRRYSEPGWWSKHPWSAAFISWIMKKAGAGDAFRYAGAHALYIKAAKGNRLANNNNPFKAYRINEIKPQVGDLVCKRRAGSGANYENIRPGHKTHCDIVTEVHPNGLTTIGGNVRNSVSKTPVSTNADGYINQPGYFAVIRIAAPSPLDRREIGPFEVFAEVDRVTRSDIELSDQEWEEERGRRTPIRAARFRYRPVGRRRFPTRPWRPTRLRRRRRLAIFPEPSIIEQGPQDADYIRWVQSSLNRILGLRLPVDGIMEPETRSAIRSFQKRQGLPVTGIVGPDTERALIAARSGQSLGASATQPNQRSMTEPPQSSPAEPSAPDTALSAAEFDFEWKTTDDNGVLMRDEFKIQPEWFEFESGLDEWETGLDQFEDGSGEFEGMPSKPVSTTTCPAYQRGEVEKSRTQAGHLPSDVIEHSRGLLIADFGVDWRTPKPSVKDDSVLKKWLSTIIQVVRANPSTNVRILGFSDCVGKERDNGLLRRGRARRVYQLLYKLLGTSPQWKDLRLRITFIGAAPAARLKAERKTAAP